MKHDLKIGQRIFLDPQGNARRRSKEIIEVEITSIGRKFFKAKGIGKFNGFEGDRFYIESMNHDNGDYSSQYDCYTSRQEVDDKNKYEELHWKVFQPHGSYQCKKYTLDQLRKVAEILKMEV